MLALHLDSEVHKVKESSGDVPFQKFAFQQLQVLALHLDFEVREVKESSRDVPFRTFAFQQLQVLALHLDSEVRKVKESSGCAFSDICISAVASVGFAS